MVAKLKIKTAMLLSGLALSVLSGCGTTETRAKASESTQTIHESFSEGEQAKVLLRPGVMFSLQVEVDGINECDEDGLRLRQDGSAVLPIVGSVPLGGLTLSEASDKLGELYQIYYKEKPLIRLQFLMDESGASSPWGYVTVLGRVKKPGRVNLPPTRDLKLSGAIQGAAGFDTSANYKAIRISRRDENKESLQVVVNMELIGEKSSGEDIPLKAGDVVYVPETIF